MSNTKTRNRHPISLPSAVASAHLNTSETTPNEPSCALGIISSISRSTLAISRRAVLRAILGLSAASKARPAEVAPIGSGVSSAAEVAPKPKLPPAVPCSLCMDYGTCVELGRCIRCSECSFTKFRARVLALRDQGISF
jgi:hypothetical protein